MMLGVTCPKCGLMQLAGPTCKSCGAPLGAAARRPSPSHSQASRPSTPAQPRTAAPPSAAPPGTPPPIGTPGSADAGGDTWQSRQLFFHGSGGTLFGIQIVNMLLTILSLGVYYFWGKVRVRSYLLSESEFEGDRFAYHGTGKELLLGFVKAMVLLWAPLILLNMVVPLLGPNVVIRAAAGILSYLFILVVIPFAMVGARRYRLSRTSWRGIRFSFRGEAREFIKLFLTGSLLTTLTLGLYYPFFETRRYGFMASHSYIGSQKFDFDGEGRALFGSFLLTLLLTPLTLGLSWIWFLAGKQRYYWEHTSIGKAGFHSDVTGWRLFRLYLGNGLLLLFTLGLAWPWAAVRNVRFAFKYLSLEGPFDEGRIRQEAQAASTTGEGLAGILDAGFDLGA
ncbi:MAG TPA: DUF898 family protein [Candidatus Methylomirabilis sp.]|nr:DUF898 family protein [Candidatus Methylomirabilis sp.]